MKFDLGARLICLPFQAFVISVLVLRAKKALADSPIVDNEGSTIHRL